MHTPSVFVYMLSPSEIENLSPAPIASVPRAVAHLDLLRVGVISRLDAIATATNAIARDAIIADARVFVETYARAPPPAPRAPPVADERCIAIRSNGGKQCTRRRKDGTTFCGTHVRCNQSGSPDTCDKVTADVPTEKVPHTGTERALRAAVSPSGIPQFVDENGATWCAEDVCAAHDNPRPV
jgi:hypothetical protein